MYNCSRNIDYLSHDYCLTFMYVILQVFSSYFWRAVFNLLQCYKIMKNVYFFNILYEGIFRVEGNEIVYSNSNSKDVEWFAIVGTRTAHMLLVYFLSLWLKVALKVLDFRARPIWSSIDPQLKVGQWRFLIGMTVLVRN